MRTIYLRFVLITFVCLLGFVGLLFYAESAKRQAVVGAAVAEDAGFKPIFDGKTLEGWKAPEMSYWSVEEGAITARTTEQHPVKANQFLVWQFGELDDFELKLKYRISGTARANSGIQFRSRVEKDGPVVGYQADIDMAGRWTGVLYDERGRKLLAQRGQKTVISSDGRMTHTSIGDPNALWANIKKDGWNDYHIIARGGDIVLKVNGKVTAEVIDNDKQERELSGVLALQLHVGPPMTVQFKDIVLKRLKMSERKKIVLVAGPPSHGYGAHEHNAGCLLLAKLLNENMPDIYATVYRDGWPKDPTAFDNADAVALYCDGDGGHVVMRHLKEVDELMKNGVGMACIHYAVELPKGEEGNYLLDWLGGYFETFWSVNPHWVADFEQLPEHPITRGVKPFAINDEWYYHIRFVKDMQNVTPILTAIPPDSTRERGDGPHSGNPHVRARMGMPEHVAWAYERSPLSSVEDGKGGRGFGFTGGHWHWSWAHNDFRKLMLNALVWITGAEVPPDGVPSETPFLEELEANQDYPKPRDWNRQKIQKMIEQWNRPSAAGVIYRNPRVYNVDYSFELVPDPNKIDRTKDLKLWLPIPREWDSQKAVKIISVQPPPHAEYEDPEHGNRMLFWDFGKETEQPSYKVHIKYRLESYEAHAQVNPNRVVGPYDKTSKDYILYTQSTHTISITDKVKELAKIAIGDEKNPYLQAKRIFEFVRKKMRYKSVRHERGSGISSIVDFPVINQETGEEHYEGQCDHYSVFFVALCRAVGIPARGVTGIFGWGPWVKKKDLKLRSERHTKLSPDGLAAARLYGPLQGHIWAEFYLLEYGWIPVDPTWGRFGHQRNHKLILSKGRDVKIGPHAPQEASEGYGDQWIPLYKGRANAIGYGSWNIAKIRIAKAKFLHHADPFPACGLAGYGEKTFPKEDAEKNLRNWRKEVLSLPSRFTRNSMLQHLNLEQFYNKHPLAKDDMEAFVCHMLRRQLGDEKFFKLVDTYMDLRQKSNQAVSTTRFQELAEDVYGEPLDWFFNQWVNSTELPRLKLEKAAVRKDKKGWQVQGRLLQSGETTFRLPIELAIDTKNGREMQKLCVDSKGVDFDLRTQNEPQKLIVDPDYEILKIQRMPPSLSWIWDVYPELIIVYGTLEEAKANKTAAERFNDDWLGLGNEIIKADTDVNEADLKSKCVILFGRPETNKIAQGFKDIFPVKFDGNKFTWQGTTYEQPTQGAAQIVENPRDSQSLVIMYAGLSGEATQKFCDLCLYSADASYVIFNRDKQLVSGDWEGVDRDLCWDFDTDRLVQLAPNEQ